jgi:antitoxin component YwqK of YwqJK toxin-antitoxin module
MRIDDEDTYLDDGNLVYYQDKPFAGEVVTRDAEGRMISLQNYFEGMPSGLQTHWYPNGSKRAEGNSERGVAVGEWRRWYSNGQLARYSVFDHNGQYVLCQEWDKYGNLTKDRSYTP